LVESVQRARRVADEKEEEEEEEEDKRIVVKPKFTDDYVGRPNYREMF